MNVWNFTGNLGFDADQKYVQSGESVVSFSVAVKAGYGDKATTTWARCTLWGKRGEGVAQYLTKGQLVGISGEVALREYEKKDGSGKGQSLEVRVNDLTLLGNKRSDASADAMPSVSDHSAAKGNGSQPQDDDIPF